MTFDFFLSNCSHGIRALSRTMATLMCLATSWSAFATAEYQPTAGFDVAWENNYITEGRDNLDHGGISWAVVNIEQNDLVVYAIVGRADQVNYVEWNLGLEYNLHLANNVDATVGYQRIEFYGDERGSDNEFFGALTVNGLTWFVPAINYTYATEAGGYFIELSLQSPWEINQHFTLTPYIVQGFDFQYSSEEHNGANHFQFGLEAEQKLNDSMALSAHISHSIAQGDIKQQASVDNIQGSLNQTYAGIHFELSF
ncbi:hypothetical protein [Shewanella sp. SG41-4]|uniref:hypothetical protein n=1 Tax=Shewanella sp. SG41-4 TaxID=2760976 RepID=UPI002176174F|nr:hypothetical protein [Shewanella sp. SG41-4]